MTEKDGDQVNLADSWKCPRCGENRIEEIMVGVVVASRINDVPIDCTDFDYGEQTNDGGEVDRYQCEGCGYTIAQTPEELVEKLGGCLA